MDNVILAPRIVQRLLALMDRVILRGMPPRLVGDLRKGVWRTLGARIAADAVVGPGVTVLGHPQLVIHAGASIARDVVLDARGGLELGPNCLIGFESILLSSTHNASQVGIPVQDQGMFGAKIVIGERAWLGTRCVLLPGTSVGDDSIVAAAAVVTKPVPALTVAAGVPARILGPR